jgi:hypothetical protein
MLKSVIVIEASGNTLTLAEVRGNRKQADLLRYLVCRIPDCPDAEVFRQIWQKQGFFQQPVVCILPKRIVKFKTVNLPVLPDKQLENALRLEFEDGGDEIIRVLGRWEEATMLNVKAAALKNCDLAEWLAPLQAAGLKVAWSGYQARGIQNFINFHCGFLQDQCRESAYLTFSDRRAEFGVISEEAVLYCRDLELGSDDFQSSSNHPVAEIDLREELRLSIAAYQAGFGKEAPRLIWLFGKERVALENIRMVLTRAGYQINLYSQLRLGGTASGEDTPAVAPLVGLALDHLGWDPRAKLRVYTTAQLEKQELTSRLQMAGQFALAATILGGGLLMMTQANLVRQEQTTQWLAAQSDKLAGLRRKEVESNVHLAKIKRMESFLDLRGRELEFLLTLQKGLPADTLLTDLVIEGGVIRNISGVTPSVSLLLNSLQRQPALRQLKLKGNITMTDQGMERFQLEGPTKAKGIR